MKDFIQNFSKLGKDKYKENKIFFSRLKKETSKPLDSIIQELKEEEFEDR